MCFEHATHHREVDVLNCAKRGENFQNVLLQHIAAQLANVQLRGLRQEVEGNERSEIVCKSPKSRSSNTSGSGLLLRRRGDRLRERPVMNATNAIVRVWKNDGQTYEGSGPAGGCVEMLSVSGGDLCTRQMTFN